MTSQDRSLAASSALEGSAYAKLIERLQALGGCTDGHCIIIKPVGMHTNGGCRCSFDRMRMHRVVTYHNMFLEDAGLSWPREPRPASWDAPTSSAEQTLAKSPG